MGRGGSTGRIRSAMGYVSVVSSALRIACSSLDRGTLLRLILDIMIDVIEEPPWCAALYLREGDDFYSACWRGEEEPPPSAGEKLSALAVGGGVAVLRKGGSLLTDSAPPGGSGVFVPFPTQSGCCGFAAFQYSRKVALGELESEVLLALGSVCALAIEMMHLCGDLTSKMIEVERAQERLVEQERLAAIDRLIGGVAHELKNPLSSAYGLVQLMLEGEDASREMVERVARNLKRAKELVTTLLEYSRPPRLDVVSFDPCGMIEGVIQMTLYEIKKKEIEVVRDFEDGLRIWADRRQMQGVVLNLVMNAIDAMDRGGTLLVGARSLEGDWVCIRVKDTGAGIPPEAVGRVFEPFFTTKKKGTGLGLYISHKVVRGLNGCMEVESRVGEGTCFYVTLPSKPGIEGPPPCARAAR